MSPLTPAVLPRPDAIHVSSLGHNGIGKLYHGTRTGVAASSATTQNRVEATPFHVQEPFSLSRWWWLNGATVGTDYVAVCLYDENWRLVAISPRTLSAGTVNTVQYQTPGMNGSQLLNEADSTNADQYTSSAVTLLPGTMYTFSILNTHASSAPAVASIDSATAGYPTFTSRTTGQFASNAQRISIFTAVPTTEWTGTLRINFSASSGVTGASWSVAGWRHVDTTTNDGVVQAPAVTTGTSTTPLVTLSAYGSSENVGFAAFAHDSGANGAPTSGTTFEMSDGVSINPTRSLQTAWTYNDTTLDYTITSSNWGAAGIEIKSKGTGAIWIPPMRGWLGKWISGTTATLYRCVASLAYAPSFYHVTAVAPGPPEIATPVSVASGTVNVIGFTSRASP